MTQSKQQMFWTLGTLAYMVVLLGLSLQPSVGETPSALNQAAHNLAHIPAYAILSFFLLQTFLVYGRRQYVFLQVLIISLAYGGFNEIVQGYVPGRTPSFSDEMLNTIGTVLTLWICRQLVADTSV